MSAFDEMMTSGRRWTGASAVSSELYPTAHRSDPDSLVARGWATVVERPGDRSGAEHIHAVAHSWTRVAASCRLLAIRTACGERDIKVAGDDRRSVFEMSVSCQAGARFPLCTVSDG